MKKNSSLIFAGVFLVLCILLCAGVWFSLHGLYVYREEFDQLDAERNNNTGIITNLEARNASLSRITKLSINQAGTVPDAIVFYGMARQIIEMHSIGLLSMTSSGQNDSGKRDNTLNLKLSANYYQLAYMFADLRNLPVASKITSLRINRNHDLPEELVEADVTIEVMTE